MTSTLSYPPTAGRLIAVLLALFAACGAGAIAHAQEQKLTWSVGRFDADDQNKGAYLRLAIPETDAVQVDGSCGPDTGEGNSELHFATDIGALQDGARVDVRFSGGGEEHTLIGEVKGANAEVGITGVVVRLAHDHKLWDALRRQDEISYQVPGYNAATLELAAGRRDIARFLRICRALKTEDAKAISVTEKRDDESDTEAADTETEETASDETAAEDTVDEDAAEEESDEKDAFEAAERLGTAAAWRAFLANFPNGFRADLARAHLKKLKDRTASDDLPPRPDKEDDDEVAEAVDLGPGTTPWRNIRIEMDEGNSKAYAAAVKAGGLEFVAYCTEDKEVATLVRPTTTGAYPKFDQRLGDGLKALSGDAQSARIPMFFDNGNEYEVSANVMGLTGELSLMQGDDAFDPDGSIVKDIMGRYSMTISAPPFAATFQLKDSRKAMCAMLKRCGVRHSGCEPREPAEPVISERTRCQRPYVYLEGQCVHRADVRAFCGPGYRRRGSQCVPRNSYYGAVCPPGMILEFGVCVEDD